MAPSRRLGSSLRALLALQAAAVLAPVARARNTTYIYGTDVHGVTRSLAVDRYPSLYTGDFGDCLGGESLFNITKFDAAYYADNSTILFHIDGTSNIRNESLILYMSVDAYGEARFQQAFDPCAINVASLCPLNASIPIEAWARIPLTPQQVADIPQIALEIPDFEGSTTIQIFANSTQTRIGCFRAVMVNGNSFSHPEAIGPVLGLFTGTAIAASFATAAYGVSIPHMRSHYGHSLSVLIILETFQSIFLSGALSVHWPRVLPAWWSNFAWSVGLIYSRSLVDSLNGFTGVMGNASQIGGAGSTVINNNGGLIQQIYGRSLDTDAVASVHSPVGAAVSSLVRRAPFNESNPYDYTWAGQPVDPGLPLPADLKGFAATLAVLKIPAADAFLISLIWLVVCIGLLILVITIFKLSLEIMATVRWIKEDRLGYFRSHWIGYVGLAVLRLLFISTFALATLASYQLATRGLPGPLAIAAACLVLFLLGMGGTVAYACSFRLRFGKFATHPDRIVFVPSKSLGFLPTASAVRVSKLKEGELPGRRLGSVPFFRVRFIDDDPNRPTVHQDQPYVKRFGWLTARYRRSRWWFFAFWFVYQVARAGFVGGAVGTPLAQVYGLFAFDVVTFCVMVALRPFEGSRNNALAIWLLGLVKMVTSGISIAFLPQFNIDRIIATVLGIIIIIAQGVVVIALMILVVLGAISSHMSVHRNRENYKPHSLDGMRIRYFERLEKVGPDVMDPAETKWARRQRKKEQKRLALEEALKPKEPHFEVTAVRRAPKIEDEDDDFLADMEEHVPQGGRVSRTNSMSSRMSVGSLPRAARAHRTSWSSRDFAQWDAQLDRPDSALAQRAGTPSGIPGGGPEGGESSSAAAALVGNEPAVPPSGGGSNNEAATGRADSMRSTRTTPTPSAAALRQMQSLPVLNTAQPTQSHPHPHPHVMRLQTSSGSFRAASSSSAAPMHRPQTPLSPSRPMTPTLEVRMKHSQERFGFNTPPPANDGGHGGDRNAGKGPALTRAITEE